VDVLLFDESVSHSLICRCCEPMTIVLGAHLDLRECT
jgi:hypothetical protein